MGFGQDLIIHNIKLITFQKHLPGTSSAQHAGWSLRWVSTLDLTHEEVHGATPHTCVDVLRWRWRRKLKVVRQSDVSCLDSFWRFIQPLLRFLLPILRFVIPTSLYSSYFASSPSLSCLKPFFCVDVDIFGLAPQRYFFFSVCFVIKSNLLFYAVPFLLDPFRISSTLCRCLLYELFSN